MAGASNQSDFVTTQRRRLPETNSKSSWTAEPQKDMKIIF